jgi:RNA 2',3'-cyclic 3'-phosphodiesterase
LLETTSMLRLFIAIPTPPSVLPSLAGACDALREVRADVKWEPTEKLHCTIKFLGDTKEEFVSPIIDALTLIAKATPPFRVRYARTGCFPGRRDPRIVWAGMEDPEGRLEILAASIDEAMSTFGFEREHRAFHPHVTLGRVKGPRLVHELLETMETVTLHNPPVTIHEIELVRSTLKPGGSEYSPLTRVELVGT